MPLIGRFQLRDKGKEFGSCKTIYGVLNTV